MPIDTPAWTARLDRARFQADPLADDTVDRILVPWADTPESAAADDLARLHADNWSRLGRVTRLMQEWQHNGALATWRANDPQLPAQANEALEHYVHKARALPAWAEPGRIERAETTFFDYGPLSCVLLFCASLPECYVLPDLSDVLHATGQLERHTEYRIRATGAMIFPVMMRGGLATPGGGGVAQVLKVRLIHATVRHLILRGTPRAALERYGANERRPGLGAIPRLGALAGLQQMHQALFAHGWRLGDDGLPCNQADQAYTLLTFGYVMLRGMRTLDQRLPRADEADTLHAWNVMGHLAGIEDGLMVHTMDEAAELFELMQSRGRSHPVATDVRPELGRALMSTMEDIIPLDVVKPFPRLLTRELIGARSAGDIGIGGEAPLASRMFFTFLLEAAHVIDDLVRLVAPRFSLVRWLSHRLGYRFLTRVLMGQTRSLALPEHLMTRLTDQLHAWRGGARP